MPQSNRGGGSSACSDPNGKEVVGVAPVQFMITTKDPAITGYIMSRLPDNYIGMQGGVFPIKRASGKNKHNWTDSHMHYLS